MAKSMTSDATSAPPILTKPMKTPIVAWSSARAIANSRLPQAATIIPIIGYALIWSDQLQDFAYFKSLQPSLFLTPVQRLQCLYWGAIFMSIGWLLYSRHCPKIVRRANEPEDYVNEHMNLRNVALLERTRKRAAAFLERHNYHPMTSETLIFGSIQPDRLHKAANYMRHPGADVFSPSNTDFIATLLTLNYHLENIDNKLLCLMTLIFLVGGAITFLTPSIEVFFMVLRNTFLNLI